MRRFLEKIFVLQGKKINGGKRHRVNPYNPLSYVVIVLAALVGVFMFGFVGIFKEVDQKNPFKWQ